MVGTYVSKEGAHPCENIPSVFGGAELSGIDGRAIITAILGAYEVHCRLCDVAKLSSLNWDHDTYGALSSALGFGKAMKLSFEQLHQSVNIACVHAPMLGQTFEGRVSMWKSCTFASNAQIGVMATLLAKNGMYGPREVFEGAMGFAQDVSGQFNLDIMQFGGHQNDFCIHQIINIGKIFTTYSTIHPTRCNKLF